MIDRRDLLIGAGCLAAIGGAESLRPRREIDLVGNTTLREILPRQFGQWREDPNVGVVTPPSEGSLADRLYNEILIQAYTDSPSRPPVMVVATHGAKQSDALQLHRPESCYPAVGFAIIARALIDMPIGGGATLPAVRLTARLGERVEDIVYWTRLGEDFPQTGGDQRSARLRAALRGTIGDGVLARASVVRIGANAEYARIEQFIRSLIAAIRPDRRRALIGTQRSQAMAASA
jgi:EpsI family protein